MKGLTGNVSADQQPKPVAKINSSQVARDESSDANFKLEDLQSNQDPNERQSRWAAPRHEQPSQVDQQFVVNNNDLKTSIYGSSAQGFAGKASTIKPAEEGFHSLQGLMGEKERARQEIQRIEGNKSLTRADKNRAIKQVKGLTRTIDGLIDREKDKISEHYESQLASQIRMSTLQQNQGPQQTFHNQQELFALARTEEDEVKNSGSFNLKASLGMSDDSALREQRPLLREDI